MATRSALPSEKPSRLVIAGDWHGDTDHARSVVGWAHRHGADGILQLGDFGIWAGRDGRAYLHELNRALNAAGMWLAFIDGNHENFDWLDALPIRRGVRPVTQRITHLPRGHRWTWGERTWLALGGAVSMDRKWRKPRIDWWPQEELTWAQARSTIEAGPVDYMLTHDAPLNVDVPGLTDEWPEDALKSAAAHRALLQTVVEDLQPAYLFHGHMHVRHRAVIEHHDGASTTVDGMASNIEPFMHNVMLIDLDVRGRVVPPL